MIRFVDYFYILVTIACTAGGQSLLKWRLQNLETLPDNWLYKPKFVLYVAFDPIILSGLVISLMASLVWIAAISKFELSFAYPFLSLNFVVVLLVSVFFLNESVNISKILGIAFIVLGAFVIARS